MTAFTASDFGRTLASNGDGSDHGWGGHHFVVGGAVKGRPIYGTPPPVEHRQHRRPDDGTWARAACCPPPRSTSTPPRSPSWFGVADAELDGILPNLRNFGGTPASGIAYPRDVGFMV